MGSSGPLSFGGILAKAKNMTENWIRCLNIQRESSFGGNNRGNRLEMTKKRVLLVVEHVGIESNKRVTNKLIVIKHEFSNMFISGKEVYITYLVFLFKEHGSVELMTKQIE